MFSMRPDISQCFSFPLQARQMILNRRVRRCGTMRRNKWPTVTASSTSCLHWPHSMSWWHWLTGTSKWTLSHTHSHTVSQTLTHWHNKCTSPTLSHTTVQVATHWLVQVCKSYTQPYTTIQIVITLTRPYE